LMGSQGYGSQEVYIGKFLRIKKRNKIEIRII
jgi:hypothetical protein